jgi:F0F1-type ATP synthase assembly protein I
MSKWFLIVLLITFLSSIFAIVARVQNRKDTSRIENGELSADDFDIIE